MPLVTTDRLLDPARAAHRGVGAFNVIQIEHAEAFVAAATRVGCGVVLQISQNAARWHGALEPLAAATLAVARAAEVPVAVHLDHAEDRDLVTEALDLGFTSVMYDGSALDYDDNVAATAAVVAQARAVGAFVEAELGKVGGKDGVHAPGVRTDPAEAVAFVEATEVDALAVAVGSSHAMTDRTASLDLARVAELRAAVPVPLVLHGSSGVPDAELARAVEAGMTKINVSTHLNSTLTTALRTFLDENPAVVDPRKYLGAGRDAMRDEVVRLLGVLRAA
ncbi:class II fructose-bisphosphate aldolase [Cellulosimicrobium funkei]|uniref:class II fructose-bisphosphate aldolase n=1 Tax=Cellulosimicrobium funkei TaxID=264251 RepID=UPI003D75096B